MRHVLPEEKIHPAIRAKIDSAHRPLVDEAVALVEAGGVVVFGMSQNPYCRKVRRMLSDAGITFVYKEYGGYLGEWRPRNALKMWTGWPTFPMVFVDGVLIGGASDTEALIASGELKPVGAA